MINQNKSPRSTNYKPWLDITVLTSAHVILFPLWIILWIIIPISIWIGDRGPIFFRQKRVGKNGTVFTILKFRTMIPNADKYGPAWTSENDPRITRVGKILRKTALDELPSLISIFRGHMSFVGPRALDLDEEKKLEQLIPGFERRLQINPGLTGLSQVYNKQDDPFDKFKYDMEYLEKLNPILDVQLLILSVKNTLVARWDSRSGKNNFELLTNRTLESTTPTTDIKHKSESSGVNSHK